MKKIRGLIQNGKQVKTWHDRWDEMGGFAQLKDRRFAAAKTSDETAEILIYEQIGESFWDDSGVGAKTFVETLRGLGNVSAINVRINSPGGDVFEADAIYSALVAHKATINVFIDGIAASAASYIAMAGDTIAIAEHAKFMIHNAWGIAIGNADEMRDTASLLDTIDGSIRLIYQARTNQSDKKLKDWMSAETWFVGQEAVDNGFADSVIAAKRPAESSADDGLLETMRMRVAMAMAKKQFDGSVQVA